MTSYPSASRSVLALARKLGWSSTIRTVTSTVSSPDPARRIRLPTLFLPAYRRLLSSFCPCFRPGCDRDLDIEDRALAVVGLDPDPPVHAPDELPRDVQAQAGATDASGHVRIEPVELLEDPAVLDRRDPEAGVRHGETDDVGPRLD